MNAQSIIHENATLTRDEKLINLKLAQAFDNYTPDSLYMDYYELPQIQPGTTSDQWEQFLEIPEIYRYRHGKIAKLTEFSATKALKELNNSPGNVSALKEIIKMSKQLQGANSNREKIILTYVRPKEQTI